MLTREGDALKVAGPMNIDSVSSLLAQSAGMLEGVTLVDLAGVTEADSSAVSLLLEWRRQAKGDALRFANLPPALKSLADLYGVANLIPQ
ncbi:MAG: STAS domain-containing protein [Hydrogenophilales bacterium]|nr:STAS domain-containing protein [Hydrogenophilales bacterium]